MMLTVDDAKQWCTDNREDLDRDREACKDESFQMMNRISPDLCRTLWDAGCWLEHVLLGHGASEEKVRSIQFAHGQRSFGRDTFAVAVAYANEFIESRAVKDKPGLALAQEINDEIFGKGTL